MVLKRDPAKVKESIKEDGDSLIALAHCKVQIPERFTQIELGQIGVNTSTLGCLAIILDDGSYATMIVAGIVELDPYKTITTTINDVGYYEFYFDEGDSIINNLNIVKSDEVIYPMFKEFIFQGKVPWYMNYTDVCKLFDTAKEYANSNVGDSQETIEFIASIIGRSTIDKSKYLRTVIKSYSYIDNKNVAFVPLMSVLYSVKSTLNKLSGAYFSDGITSAIVSPSESSSDIERIVRS